MPTTSAISEYTRAWFWPIAPTPITPTRMDTGAAKEASGYKRAARARPGRTHRMMTREPYDAAAGRADDANGRGPRGPPDSLARRLGEHGSPGVQFTCVI